MNENYFTVIQNHELKLVPGDPISSKFIWTNDDHVHDAHMRPQMTLRNHWSIIG